MLEIWVHSTLQDTKKGSFQRNRTLKQQEIWAKWRKTLLVLTLTPSKINRFVKALLYNDMTSEPNIWI